MQITDIPVSENRRETTRQGSPDYPVAVYYSVMSANVLGYTKLHWHEELQFCLVTRGTFRFYVEDQNAVLNTGDGIFINSGKLHMARPLKNPDSSYICLDVHERLLSGFPGSVLQKKYIEPLLRDGSLPSLVLRPSEGWQKEILQQIRKIYEISETRPYAFELSAEACLYHIFAQLLAHRPVRVSAPRLSKSSESAQRILRYMESHYQEKITLSDIAAFASFSKEECCRIFKRYTGVTISRYLSDFRLEQSVRLLQSSDMSVTDIAAFCGFASASRYISVFRERFHTTPRKYRAKNTGFS